MLIGLTGRIASGKGIVADYFIEKGFRYFSLSQEVREEARRRGIEITRKNLQDLGNEIREKEGAAAWAKRIKKKIRPGNYVIDGIRNPAEVKELLKLPDFKLISVDSPQEIRYKRVISRAKGSDKKTWEGFLEMDNRDFGENSESGQQVGRCMEMAEFKILNDSDLDNLYKKLNGICVEIKC